MVQALLSPLTNIALPTISRLRERPEKVDEFFDTGVRIAGLVGFPVFVGFAAIAPDAVPFIFGAHWASAVLPVQILMLLGLLRTVDGLCGLTLVALGHSKLVLLLSIVYTVLLLITLPIGASMQLEGALTAQLLCSLLLVPIFLSVSQRVAKLDVLAPLKFFPRLATSSGVLYMAVTGWRLCLPAATPHALAVGSAILIGGAVYGVMGLILMRPELFRAVDMLTRVLG